MQKKLYSLLLVVGLMLVLPLSIAAVGTTNVDVDSPYVECSNISLTNSPSGVKGDAIAISTSDAQSGCLIVNTTQNTYDIAVQYRTGIEYGAVRVVRYRNDDLSIKDHIFQQLINQNDLLRRLVTTGSIRLTPDSMLLVVNASEGMVNLEGFVVRKR